MTESNVTGVDPRYDPRFQRGYSGARRGGCLGPGPSAVATSHRSPGPCAAARQSLEELRAARIRAHRAPADTRGRALRARGARRAVEHRRSPGHPLMGP